MFPSDSCLRWLAASAALAALLLCLSPCPVSCQSASVFQSSGDVSEVWEQTLQSIRSGAVTSATLGSAIDPNDGTVVTVGYATGTLLFHSNLGGLDAWVVKTEPTSGSVLWSRWFATAQDDWAVGVCVDAAGNVLVTGTTGGFMQGRTNYGDHDVFAVKLTADGQQVWLQQYGGQAEDAAGGCVVDVYGQIYMTGMTDGGWLGTVYTAVYSVVLAQLDSGNGSVVAGRALGSGGGNQYLYYFSAPPLNAQSSGGAASFFPAGRGLAVINPIANVSSVVQLIVGCILDSGAVFPDAPAPPAGRADSVVAAYYASNLTLIWAQRFASAQDDLLYGLATDSTGAVFATGQTFSNLDGGLYNANGDAFLSKIGATGSKLWTRLFGSTLADYGAAMAVDNAGGLYLSGGSQVEAGVLSLDSVQLPYAQVFPSGSGTGGALLAGFLSKFDSDGARLWTGLLSTDMPLTQPSNLSPSLTVASISFDQSSGALYLAGKKSGYLPSDAVQTAITAADLFQDETFLMAVQQAP